MGDPITTGILVGAAMGGGGAALKGDDPLKGALIGGATGGVGGGLAGSFGGAAGAGGGFTGGGYGSVGPSGFSALSGSAAPAASGGMFSGMSMPSTITGLGKDIGALNTFMNQNPITSQIGLQTASSLIQPDQPMQMAPAGQVQRGQIQPMDYMSLLNPQGQSVMRPQPISLL
jgi:hypothetical protein